MTTCFIKGLVFFGIPHVLGLAGKLLLELLAGDTTEFCLETFNQFFTKFEVTDKLTLVELVMVPAALGTQGHQATGQGTTGTQAGQAATP